ncbi:hypothetical protein L1987_58267 [Smallanthus sonchifolius]|uniref:Uncharacterized protein n=1 Tax=Smallanthus sonchifolius TaxID=185202 RepID=A0ACB9DFC3_9ASTR|nr:hypothetical protein L1987_58267 [Smallanthus sonchifolius]
MSRVKSEMLPFIGRGANGVWNRVVSSIVELNDKGVIPFSCMSKWVENGMDTYFGSECWVGNDVVMKEDVVMDVFGSGVGSFIDNAKWRAHRNELGLFIDIRNSTLKVYPPPTITQSMLFEIRSCGVTAGGGYGSNKVSGSGFHSRLESELELI